MPKSRDSIGGPFVPLLKETLLRARLTQPKLHKSSAPQVTVTDFRPTHSHPWYGN